MNASPPENTKSQKAWVVFSSQTDLPWLRILKPGFRHCSVLLHDGQRWFSLDPLSGHMEVEVHDHVSGDFDLPGWLKKQGHAVVSAPLLRHHKKPAPYMIFTCVEAVKRVLGLHKAFIITPWQLYRFLKGHPQTKGDLQWEA